jgi:hypothetical protein
MNLDEQSTHHTTVKIRENYHFNQESGNQKPLKKTGRFSEKPYE